jgi:tetratricopeptide (TPR) repeat protein
MNKRRTKARDREQDKQQVSAPAANRRNRLVAGIVVVVSLGVGAVAVERLTRPSDRGLSTVVVPQALPIVEPEPLIPPPAAEPTFTETVTEGKQLGMEIAEQFPDDPQALALAGKVQFTFGNPDQAQADWKRTIELDPESPEAWLGMAKTAHKQGDFEKAVQCMGRLEEVAPAVAETQAFFLVDSLLKLGRPQEVVDQLERLGQSAALPAGARVTLGQAYYQLKNYERSADHYRQALDDPQQAGVAHYGLSMALVRLGRQDEAKTHRQEYVRLQQEGMEVFDRMQKAGTDQERNDPKPLYPLLAGFHFETAKLYAIRGLRDPAEEHAFRAWAFAPERPEPRLLLESFRR